ncbi:MAG TPA: ubiquitin-like small modifier protein 1 [Anaerolineales bacterium]|nr:ubiquitin-like small modifier protein 1 [Anaerolineales bacterium]
MSTLRIPTPLRPYANGQSEIEITGATVGDALGELTQRYPALKTHLFSEDGELRAFVNLFLNAEDVRQMQGVQTPIKEGDKLMILPSIAGGASRRSCLARRSRIAEGK